MAAKLKTKRTSITTMGAKIQAFDIFQTPLSSHYPLPLSAILSALLIQCFNLWSTVLVAFNFKTARDIEFFAKYHVVFYKYV
jgi:hypothetical protein